MIILDTNVLSGLTRRHPYPQILQWVGQWPSDLIWMTAVSILELEYGIQRMSDLSIRAMLRERTTRIINEVIRPRILVFDEQAARIAGDLRANRERVGRPIDLHDLMIASIALAHGATLATRNVRHFEQLGLQIVNPWDVT
jgi:predicted nucleic acid-binding protein